METVTIEDVLRLIRESEAAAARRAEEADRRVERVERLIEEAARRADEAARRTEQVARRAEEERARRAEEEAQRADEEARLRSEAKRRADEEARLWSEAKRRADEEARLRSEDLDRRFAEATAAIASLAAENKKVEQQIGALSGKWGRFVESLVVPACRTLFIERGIAVHEVHERVQADRGSKSMEIDVLVVNDDDAVLVEVKSTLGVDDVRSHLDHIAGFRELFPTYRHHTLYGALAGIVVPKQVARFVINQGVFLIVPSGDTVAIANPPEFRPRAW